MSATLSCSLSNLNTNQVSLIQVSLLWWLQSSGFGVEPFETNGEGNQEIGKVGETFVLFPLLPKVQTEDQSKTYGKMFAASESKACKPVNLEKFFEDAPTPAKRRLKRNPTDSDRVRLLDPSPTNAEALLTNNQCVVTLVQQG